MLNIVTDNLDFKQEHGIPYPNTTLFHHDHYWDNEQQELLNSTFYR